MMVPLIIARAFAVAYLILVWPFLYHFCRWHIFYASEPPQAFRKWCFVCWANRMLDKLLRNK